MRSVDMRSAGHAVLIKPLLCQHHHTLMQLDWALKHLDRHHLVLLVLHLGLDGQGHDVSPDNGHHQDQDNAGPDHTAHEDDGVEIHAFKILLSP